MTLTQKFVQNQDFQILKQLCKKLNSLDRELMDNRIQKFYYEGIFLDLTDCSQSHPKFEVKQKNTLRSFFNPLSVRDIVWEVPGTFRLESYFGMKWFSGLIVECDDYDYIVLNIFKEQYIKNEINFLEFHLRRCDTYLSQGHKTYKDIFNDLNKFNDYELKITNLYREYTH